MKKLLDYECARDFNDLLIERVKEKLDIYELDYPISDDGEPTINFVIRDYLGWTTAVAAKVQGAPDLETFIYRLHRQLIEKGIIIEIEQLRQWTYAIIDNCIDEIQAWKSVVQSFLKYQTINEKMIETVANYYHIQ